jgi:hypothetical protein
MAKYNNKTMATLTLIWMMALCTLKVLGFVPSTLVSRTAQVYAFVARDTDAWLMNESPLQTSTILRMSSVGGGSDDRPPGGRGRGGSSPLGDWLDPENDPNKNKRIKDSQRQRSESRLPISFGTDKMDTTKNGASNTNSNSTATSAAEQGGGAMTLASLSSDSSVGGALVGDNNPYVKVVQDLTPSELIGRFTSTAHPRVQSAVKSTILGLIGNLPKMAFETKTVTTGERLASLMFQLQMTGYMFKNAEYRLTMANALGLKANESFNTQKVLALKGVDVEEEDDVYNPDKTTLKGKIKVKYPGLPSLIGMSSSTDEAKEDRDAEEETLDPLTSGYEVEVDANAYMSELRMEVKKLRDDLEARRNAKEEELRKDLLAYIRTLPEQQLRELTSTVSPDVLSAMKGLVNNVMEGLVESGTDEEGKGSPIDRGEPGKPAISPRTVLEQSGEAVAQLCMWQLVVGYNLRELEVREEIKSQMAKGRPADIDDTGIILDDDDDDE